MARAAVNGLPTILLSCASYPDRNVLVTEAYARKHEKLVTLARRRYGRDYPEESFGIHFHHTCSDIDADHCDAEIDDFLYDEGEYFERPYVQGDGRLKLFAHFVATNAQNVKGSTDASAIKIEDSPHLEPQLRPQHVLPPVLDEENHGHPRVRDAGVPHRTLDLQNVAASADPLERDQSVQTALTESITLSLPASSREEAQPPVDEEPQAGPSYRAPSVQTPLATPTVGSYPALPLEATPERLIEVLNDPVRAIPSGVWANKERAIQIKDSAARHAALIDGMYGIEASSACKRCETKGKSCRVYHPDAVQMYARVRHLDKNRGRFGLGIRCSSCRGDRGGRRIRCEPSLFEHSQLSP